MTKAPRPASRAAGTRHGSVYRRPNLRQPNMRRPPSSRAAIRDGRAPCGGVQTSSGDKVSIISADSLWTSASRSRVLGNRVRLDCTMACCALASCQWRAAAIAASQPSWKPALVPLGALAKACLRFWLLAILIAGRWLGQADEGSCGPLSQRRGTLGRLRDRRKTGASLAGALGAVTRQRSGAEGGCRGLHGPRPWATAFQGLARLPVHGDAHQVGRTLARGRRGTRRNCPHDCRTGPGAVATMQIGVARSGNREISAPALHPGQASPGGSSWASRPAFPRVLWCRLTFMTDAMPLRGRN